MGPGSRATPARSAAWANAVAPGAGSRSHSEAPPAGGENRQSGSSSATVAATVSRARVSAARRRSRASSMCGSNRAVTSWASTEVPRSSPPLTEVSVATVAGSARSQPTRRPPQNDLLAEPIMITGPP